MNFTSNRYQMTEIKQISGSRQNSVERICQMQPAKFLPNASCSLLNQKGAF